VLAPQGGDHRTDLERRVHGIARDVRDGQRHLGAVDRHQFVHQQPAERALVDEPQLGTVIAEAEPHAQVLLVRGADRLDQQLAAHPQVGEQRETLVEFGPQVLAAPPGRDHRAPGQPAGEVGGTRQVPADRAGMVHLYGRERAADHVCFETEPDDLDLGKLRHQTVSGRPP
jgi:hypothetical protein